MFPGWQQSIKELAHAWRKNGERAIVLVTVCWGKKTCLVGSDYLVVCELLILVGPDLNKSICWSIAWVSLVFTHNNMLFCNQSYYERLPFLSKKIKLCSGNEMKQLALVYSMTEEAVAVWRAQPHHFSEFVVFISCSEYMNHTQPVAMVLLSS